MVKFKTIKAEFKNEKVVKLGYCQGKYLLKGLNAIAYTRGVYGWNCDIYKFQDYYICTGYRPFGTITPDYKVVEKYEKKAKKIWYDLKMSYSQQKMKLLKLLQDFINEIK